MGDNVWSWPRWTAVLPALALLDIFVIVAAIAARHLFHIAPLAAFRFFFFGAQAGLVLAAIGICLVGAGLLTAVPAAWKNGAAAALLGLLPLGAALAVVGPAGFSAPMIHDISTDLGDPPEFRVARTLRGPHENSLDHAGAALVAAQKAGYPDLEPILTPLKPAAAQARAVTVARSLGWDILDNDPAAGRIEATDTTALYGFVDDVVIRVRPAGGGSRVDLRSVSRVGMGDLGANAGRIRRFITAFAQGRGDGAP